jgi:transposase
MTIRYLAREGEQIATLARRFGLSRQTVYNHLARATAAPTPGPRRPSALDPFRDYLRTRLESFDLPAPVLLRELRTRGYTGGLTILRDAMRPLKAEQIRRVTERFETLPGRQAQADWGECGTITSGGETTKLYLFVLVLVATSWRSTHCFMLSTSSSVGMPSVSNANCRQRNSAGCRVLVVKRAKHMRL